jgi:hypothetical protein
MWARPHALHSAASQTDLTRLPYVAYPLTLLPLQFGHISRPEPWQRGQWFAGHFNILHRLLM